MGETDRRMIQINFMNIFNRICGTQWSVAGLLLVYVVLCQMVFNIDSYLYANNGHYDSAIFFFCGKSLMNGYTPYVDFADSKGLLLWIIYGIGYLIHPYSYIGVFWLACLAFTVALGIAYKTARLYLDKSVALLAAMSMAIPYWYWNFYTEGKAEHFCMPIVAFAIYQLLKLMETSSAKRGFSISWMMVGCGWVAVLMMKWSIALMMVSLLVSIGVYAWKRDALKDYLASMMTGISALALPFLVYFVLTDSLGAMWHEYFANTMASVSEPLAQTIVSYSHEWLGLVTSKRIIYIVYTLPLLLLWNRKEWFASAQPWLSAMFFIALAIRHDHFGHYISIVAPFAIFAIVSLLGWIQKHHLALRYYSIVLVLALCYLVWGKIHYGSGLLASAQNIKKFEEINWRMAKVKNPTLLIMGQDPGYCMGYSRPYCRYWISQMGQTQAMFDAQEKALAEGKADFVSLNGEGTIRKYEPLVLSRGYRLFEQYGGNNIYTKHLCPPIPKSFRMTDFDVLTKRNMAGFK